MLRERGGSSSFARHAFNELVAFIAGWAILIDYLIVAALAAISVPHYLAPISGDFSTPGLGDRHRVAGDRRRLRAQRAQHHRPRPRAPARRSSRSPTSLLQLAVIVVGVLVVFHPERLTEQLDLFTDPSAVDIVYASVVAMLAYAGIEAASDLAPDIDVHPRDLKRVVSVGARRGAARLRRDGGRGADGGAGRRRARRAADGARLGVRRGAGARRRLRLRPARGRRRDAMDRRPDRARPSSSGR